MTKEERKEYNKKYHDKNREKIKLRKQLTYRENKETLLLKQKYYVFKNKEKNRLYHKKLKILKYILSLNSKKECHGIIMVEQAGT